MASDSSYELVGAVGRFVREVGFPVAVAVFVLWRLDGRVGELVSGQDQETRLLREIRDRQCVGVLELPGVIPRREGLEVEPQSAPPPSVGPPQAGRLSLFRALSLRQRVDF